MEIMSNKEIRTRGTMDENLSEKVEKKILRGHCASKENGARNVNIEDKVTAQGVNH